MSIQISFPIDNAQEREYAVTVLMHDILGVNCELRPDGRARDYTISIGGRPVIVVVDGFFGRFPRPLEYLNAGNLPAAIGSFSTPLAKEGDIPVLFGEGRIEKEPGLVKCHIDLFAGTFFLVTCWEEIVNPERDDFGRFAASSSLVGKAGLLHRPIANEYAELIWALLLQQGYKGRKERRVSQIVPTHDVDKISYPWKNISLGKAFHSKREFQLALRRVFHINPYDTFRWLMSTAEKASLQARFYFMAQEAGETDYRYSLQSPLVKRVVDGCRMRGHLIGFHPSMNSQENALLWRTELDRLQSATGSTPHEGRQHYLRFQNPYTWELWEANGMAVDSTLGYFDHEGFRCGTACEFPVFHVLQRRSLRLRERPLVVMDGTMHQYRRLRLEDTWNTLAYYRGTCRHYGMPMTVLFHNASFDELSWPGYRRLYRALLREA
jgi:hypothetical protein